MRTPLHSEAELRHHDRAQSERLFSYDLTQKLSFFVISIELIFCGYILLNADKLGQIKGSSMLFLLAGVAAFCGITWRYCYNQTYHLHAHGVSQTWGLTSKAQTLFYWLYASASVMFLVLTLWWGFQYLQNIESKTDVAKANEILEEAQNKESLPIIEKSNTEKYNSVPSEKMEAAKPQVNKIKTPSKKPNNAPQPTPKNGAAEL